MFVSVVILQVGPALRSGRSLHRVSGRGDSQPGGGSLTGQLKQLSIGECRYMVLRE
jgi:hypothetical protein